MDHGLKKLRERVRDSLNKVAKWRAIFAAWQLGTRASSDGESCAVRDHREATIMLRIEANAMARLLLARGLFTEAEWLAQLIEEAEALERAYEEKFPGAKAMPDGMFIDTAVYAETARRLNFPP